MILTIRRAQMKVFERDVVAEFIRGLVAYLNSEYSGTCQRMGEAAVREFVERGMKKAAAQGIKTRGAIAVYIELMLQFGEDFERAKDREWAKIMLAHPTLPDYVKIETISDRLQTATGGRVIRVVGAESEAPKATA